MTTAANDAGGVAEHVYQSVRRAILSGEHPPGSRMVEGRIARSLAVSRTPVRAALARLASDGLVTSSHYRSAVVSSWSETSLDEIYGLRILLECHAAKLAAERATKADLDRLEALAAELDEQIESKPPGYPESGAELNAEFHIRFVEASKSDRLIAIASGLIELPLVRQAILARPADEVARSWSQHRIMVEALRDKDGELAAALIRAHLLGGLNGLRRALHVADAE
jgi:DNA-binding GntR family transcriptional regulator